MKIYLVGFSGAGKTYFAKVLTEQYGVRCFDLDCFIEYKTGLEIKEIFFTKGLDYFRSLETEYLHLCPENSVIATGGGVVDREVNRLFLKKEQNFIIWLHTPWSVIAKRLKQMTDRPLVDQMNEKELNQLWLKRCSLYSDVSDFCCKNPTAEKLFKCIDESTSQFLE